jgi:hypothetical protein
MEKTLRNIAIRISKEAAFILLTVASAVVFPQILHTLGAALGLGGSLGQMLLPMYLPVMILGFYRGEIPAAITGLAAPLVSFMLTGMPQKALLPYIIIELIATGIFAGVLTRVKFFAPLKVLSVQFLAKIVRLSVFAVALYSTTGAVSASALTAGLLTSIPGLVLQLVVVSIVIVKKESKHLRPN